MQRSRGKEEEWSCCLKFNLKLDGGIDERGVAGVEEKKKGCGVLVRLNWPPSGGSKSVMTEVLNVFRA